MKDDFLRDFVQGEKYLQNHPMETEDFIKYCSDRSIQINENDLEFFERERILFPIIRINRPIYIVETIEYEKDDGSKGWRLKEDGLRDGEKEIGKREYPHYSMYGFGEFDKNHLMKLLADGNLFDPSKRNFREWTSFEGDGLGLLKSDFKRVVSFYSSFQIYWIDFIKKYFTMNINLLRVNRNNLDNICNQTKDYLYLKNSYPNFEHFLEFALSIQNIYTPYGKSGAKSMQIISEKPNSMKWHEQRKNFDPKTELENKDFDIRAVAYWYKKFCRKSEHLLGAERADWMQIWKNIDYDYKDKLERNNRLGVEYLQWALMLKKFIEDYLGREILDIDESSGVTIEYILDIEPNKIRDRTLRGVRNRDLLSIDHNIDHYHNLYRRLFYLSNKFGLDYQPRIMVFVEGGTEETILPELFEWCFGEKPENYGIEIINYQGVDKLLSTSDTIDELRKLVIEIEKHSKSSFISKSQKKRMGRVLKELKRADILISNWSSFISLNLEKWQIVPFFVSDNESFVKKRFLDEKIIRFNGNKYKVPDNWKYIWGVSNSNKPFEGSSFEFANFTNDEIISAISSILDINVNPESIEALRLNKKGLKEIDRGICNKTKGEIAEQLVNTMLAKIKEKKDESIFERPIFKLLKNLLDLAIRNDPPINLAYELYNKKSIESHLKGDNS